MYISSNGDIMITQVEMEYDTWRKGYYDNDIFIMIHEHLSKSTRSRLFFPKVDCTIKSKQRPSLENLSRQPQYHNTIIDSANKKLNTFKQIHEPTYLQNLLKRITRLFK